MKSGFSEIIQDEKPVFVEFFCQWERTGNRGTFLFLYRGEIPCFTKVKRGCNWKI